MHCADVQMKCGPKIRSPCFTSYVSDPVKCKHIRNQLVVEVCDFSCGYLLHVALFGSGFVVQSEKIVYKSRKYLTQPALYLLVFMRASGEKEGEIFRMIVQKMGQ